MKWIFKLKNNQSRHYIHLLYLKPYKNFDYIALYKKNDPWIDK